MKKEVKGIDLASPFLCPVSLIKENKGRKVGTCPLRFRTKFPLNEDEDVMRNSE